MGRLRPRVSGGRDDGGRGMFCFFFQLSLSFLSGDEGRGVCCMYVRYRETYIHHLWPRQVREVNMHSALERGMDR